MVIVKLDISNVFVSLCARLVLDVLSDKTSRDYLCDIKHFDHQKSHLEVFLVKFFDFKCHSLQSIILSLIILLTVVSDTLLNEWKGIYFDFSLYGKN
jgi:hypothetical protein